MGRKLKELGMVLTIRMDKRASIGSKEVRRRPP